MAKQVTSSDHQSNVTQASRARNAPYSDPLVLAELKRQTGMLKTITTILISFSLIVATGLIYTAIVVSGL